MQENIPVLQRQDKFTAFAERTLAQGEKSDVISAFDGVQTLNFKEKYTPLIEHPQYPVFLQLFETQSEWMKENLGIVLNPQEELNKIYFLQPDEYEKFQERLEQEIGFRPSNRGFMNVYSQELVCVDDGNVLHTLHILGHELIHRRTSRVFEAKKKNEIIDTDLLRSGIRDIKSKKFLAIYEALTEMMNLEILDVMKDKLEQPDLLMKREAIVGYPNLVIFFDELISAVCEKHANGDSLQPKEMRKVLYLGLLLGDVRPLKLFEQSLGKGTLAQLVDISPEADISDLEAVMKKVAGKERKRSYYDKAVNYDMNETVTILDKVKMKCES